MKRSITISAHAAFALLFTVAVACKGDEPSAKAEKYEVRVQVVGIEGSGEATRVILEHEAIDGFKDRDGKPDRMPAMKMAFGIAPGVDASVFTPGSKHEVIFDSVWGREPMIRVTEAKRLPDDTALVLGEHR